MSRAAPRLGRSLALPGLLCEICFPPCFGEHHGWDARATIGTPESRVGTGGILRENPRKPDRDRQIVIKIHSLNAMDLHTPKTMLRNTPEKKGLPAV